jgi:hypothetical protein
MKKLLFLIGFSVVLAQNKNTNDNDSLLKIFEQLQPIEGRLYTWHAKSADSLEGDLGVCVRALRVSSKDHENNHQEGQSNNQKLLKILERLEPIEGRLYTWSAKSVNPLEGDLGVCFRVLRVAPEIKKIEQKDI